MDPLKVGIIGCGFIGEVHARAFSLMPNVKIVGIANRGKHRRSLFRHMFKIDQSSCFEDYNQLLAIKDLDFVSVSVPNNLHRDVVQVAAEHGKHVICEKPLATNLRDADEMIEIMDSHHLKLGVYQQAFFYPENILAREIIEKKTLGKAKLIWTNALAVGKWNLTDWRLNPAIAGGGIMMDEGVHLVHLIKRYFGQKPLCASAFIDRLSQQWLPIEDTASCMFEFPSGLGVVKMSFQPTIGIDKTIRAITQGILAEEGCIEFVFCDEAEGPYSPVKKVRVVTKNGITEYPVSLVSSPMEKNLEAFKLLINDFIDSLKNDRGPAVDGRNGRESLEMVLASYESAAVGKSIRFPLKPDSPLYIGGVLGLKKLKQEISLDSIFRRKRLYDFNP